MNLNNTIGIVAVAAAMATASISGSAHAWTIKVDCHGTGGDPSWANTPDQIEIIVTYTNSPDEDVKVFSSGISTSLCDGEDEVVFTKAGKGTSNIYGVTVLTDGDNAFWIDQVLLISDGGSTVKNWGVDNNAGWCVSTDPSDGSNAYCSLPAEAGPIFVQ